MSKVNQLFQDQQEERAEKWLKDNPGKTPEDCFWALNPEPPEPYFYPWGYEP